MADGSGGSSGWVGVLLAACLQPGSTEQHHKAAHPALWDVSMHCCGVATNIFHALMEVEHTIVADGYNVGTKKGSCIVMWKPHAIWCCQGTANIYT